MKPHSRSFKQLRRLDETGNNRILIEDIMVEANETANSIYDIEEVDQ
ncbi:MAG: hypothetical protein AAGA43_15700 [Bacteroidota bacterium]